VGDKPGERLLKEGKRREESEVEEREESWMDI